MHIINYVYRSVICSLNLSVWTETPSSIYLRINSEYFKFKTEKELVLSLYQTHWTAGSMLFSFLSCLYVLSIDLLKISGRVKLHVSRQDAKEETTWFHFAWRKSTMTSWFEILVSSQHLCPISGARLYLPFAGYRLISPGRSLRGGWADTHSCDVYEEIAHQKNHKFVTVPHNEEVRTWPSQAIKAQNCI